MDDQNKGGGSQQPSIADELDALLRQSGANAPKSGIKLPGSRGFKQKPNLLPGLIVGLVLILVSGTAYLIVGGATFNTAKLTLDLNQEKVSLQIDDQGYGLVDSGATFRLKAGEHRVVLTKTDFLDLEEKITLARGDDLTIAFELLPVPVAQIVVAKTIENSQLSVDGSTLNYFDAQEGRFKSVSLAEDLKVSEMFEGSFSNVASVVWSPGGYAAIVKFNGRTRLNNMLDNRLAKGRYIPLGETPEHAPANFNGQTTLLFDNRLKTAGGWQPILLNESIRQVVFAFNGGSIAYIYEPQGGEYSLVRSWPEGIEWERVIVDMPRLTDPRFFWGPDDKYLLIEDQGKMWVIDMLGKQIDNEMFADRLAGTQVAFSIDGDRVAYVAQTDDGLKMKARSLSGEQVQTLNDIPVEGTSAFVWLDNSTLLVARPEGFEKYDIERGTKTKIPVASGEAGTPVNIRGLQYSREGRMLIISTDTNVLMMRL